MFIFKLHLGTAANLPRNVINGLHITEENVKDQDQCCCHLTSVQIPSLWSVAVGAPYAGAGGAE